MQKFKVLKSVNEFKEGEIVTGFDYDWTNDTILVFSENTHKWTRLAAKNFTTII